LQYFRRLDFAFSQISLVPQLHSGGRVCFQIKSGLDIHIQRPATSGYTQQRPVYIELESTG